MAEPSPRSSTSAPRRTAGNMPCRCCWGCRDSRLDTALLRLTRVVDPFNRTAACPTRMEDNEGTTRATSIPALGGYYQLSNSCAVLHTVLSCFQRWEAGDIPACWLCFMRVFLHVPSRQVSWNWRVYVYIYRYTCMYMLANMYMYA